MRLREDASTNNAGHGRPDAKGGRGPPAIGLMGLIALLSASDFAAARGEGDMSGDAIGDD